MVRVRLVNPELLESLETAMLVKAETRIRITIVEDQIRIKTLTVERVRDLLRPREIQIIQIVELGQDPSKLLELKAPLLIRDPVPIIKSSLYEDPAHLRLASW